MVQYMNMVSFVIPVYNEEESIQPFYKELMLSINRLKHKYELLFIDDGSTDTTLDMLRTIAKENKNARIFSFRRNQGKSEALTLGFEKARGDYIVTLDADLQDRPSEIAKLLKKVEENGFDISCGWRKDRKDSYPKIAASKLFNAVASFLWGLNLHDYNCGLKAYTKEAAKSLNLYGGLHRFIPLIAFREGFKICETPVIHSERKFGTSKYGFSKVWRDLPDIFSMLFLTRYSKRPLHFFGFIGLIFLFIGFGILMYLTFAKIFYGQGIGDRPIIFLGMLLVLSGFQVLLTGFLADLFINASQKTIKEHFLKNSSEN